MPLGPSADRLDRMPDQPPPASSDADGLRRPATGAHTAHHGATTPHRKELAWLSLGALGVVYGDIGTSPLYAMRECFGRANTRSRRSHDARVRRVSLFFWALLLVVVIKYLVFVLRADNKGEGGILALAALVQQEDKTPRRRSSRCRSCSRCSAPACSTATA